MLIIITNNYIIIYYSDFNISYSRPSMVYLEASYNVNLQLNDCVTHMKLEVAIFKRCFICIVYIYQNQNIW